MHLCFHHLDYQLLQNPDYLTLNNPSIFSFNLTGCTWRMIITPICTVRKTISVSWMINTIHISGEGLDTIFSYLLQSISNAILLTLSGISSHDIPSS